MLTEQIVVEDFVKMYYDELMEEIKYMNKKLDDVIETEEFKIWFNEQWVDERWITFVSDKVAEMSDTEKNKFLIDYGLDNVFDMFRFIGLGTDSFTVNKMCWHIIDHWYSYSYVIRTFRLTFSSKGPLNTNQVGK